MQNYFSVAMLAHRLWHQRNIKPTRDQHNHDWSEIERIVMLCVCVRGGGGC